MKKLLLLIVILVSVSNFLQAQTCPSANSWNQKADNLQRNQAFSFTIGNKAYIGGGEYSTTSQFLSGTTRYRNDFWEYDPINNVWTQCANLMSFYSTANNYSGLFAATGFSVTGKGYVLGGRTRNDAGTVVFSELFCQYDPNTNIWSNKSSAMVGTDLMFSSQNATFTINNTAYIGSGEYKTSNVPGTYPTSGPYSTKWYKYDESSNSFIGIASFNGDVYYYPVGFSANGNGYLMNYRKLYKYDPNLNSWSWTGLSHPNTGSADYNYFAFSIGNYGYIGGGINIAGSADYNVFYEYNAVNNSWGSNISFPGWAGINGATGFSIGNRGYVTGGNSRVNAYQINPQLWEFTPSGTQKTIITYSPSLTTLCKGSTTSVSYATGCSGSFYASDNVFTAYLSDVNGFFSNNPVSIGSITSSATSGSISITIPENTTEGNKYRIRVNSSSQPTIGYDNGTNITISNPGSAGAISHPYSVPYPSELASDQIASSAAASGASSYLWQSSTDNSSWTTIPNSIGTTYTLPGTNQNDVFFRRGAILACLATVYTAPVKLRLYSTSNARLNGVIKGKVRTLGGSGVPGILITVQKTIALNGSPITKTYTATTNESGDYSVVGIFYGDQDAGDPISVTFNITASKAGHVFKTPNPRTAVLSKVNIEALGIDFTDESTLTISGSIQQTCSDCETLFRSVDSLNGVTLSTSKNNINYTTNSGADGHGRYSFALTETGDYIITPSKTGHKFNPVQRTVVMGSDNISLIDFVDTTKYTISGALRAGGNQIIGSAQLEFTDTVPGRPVKFKKIVTTAADGSFSVKLPARKYKMKMLGFTPSGLGSDIGVNDLLTWFNTTLKDSNYVDIDSSNQTFNLIYHRPPVLVIDNLPDTSCGNYVVFKQEETKAFTVKIYEGAVSHNVLLGYDTVSTVKLNTAVHLAGIEPQILSYKHVKGLAQVQLTGGSPNLFDPYNKPFRVNYEDKYGRKAEVLTRNVIVFGVNADPGTFTTVSPSVPVLILHAPPGDQSTSFWEQTQTTETAMRFSALTDKTTGTFQDVKIGASFSAGIGFVVETSVWANANQSMSNSQRVNKATEAILSSSTTVGYATEPNGGDVYVGGAMNLCYSVAHELKYLAGCQLGIQNSLAVAPKGFATTFTYSEGFLRETLIPSLQFIAENNPDSSSKYLDQIKVWEQVIANNNINKARAEFVRNRSFDGNAGPITESTTSSATQSSSIEFEVEIQKDKAISAGLEIGGAGFEGGASVSLKMTTGSSSTNTNTSSTTMGYTLDDDDAGDYYSVDIKKDPVYNTPVFVLVAGTSSCPAEPIAQSRDYAQLSIPTPEIRNIPGNGEALFQLKLQNASQSRESRTYFLTFNQSSNPNGALVSIGGSPVTSNIAYTIPYMGSQLVTVSVKKSASSNVFSYEGLEFTLSDACDGGVATSSTISAFFQSPCSDLILNAPGNNWVAKLSNNNIMPVEFTGYNLSNLQSVALEYAHAGRGDWVTDTTIFQNFITNPTTTVLNWNIADIEDGSYDIRMKLNCASGSGYTQRLTGVIDRGAPSLFGLAQPTDRSYVSGDEISMTYTENIETKNLNSNKVTLTRMLDGSNIPVQVSGYNNKLMVVPLLDLSTFASGEAIRLVSKYITDVYGNESAVADTFLFSVGASVATNANRKVYVSNVDLNKSAVLENSGDSLQVKFTISTSSAYNTAVNFIVSGSATFESDYGVTFSSRQNLTTQFTGTQGTINIPANTTSATLKIKPIGDDDLEGNESVIIRLLSGGDYKIGTDRLGRDSAIVVTDTIKNDDLNKPEILIGDIPTAYPTGYCIVLKDESFVKPYVWNVPTTLPAGYCATVINPALVRTFMEIKLPTTLPTGYCVALSPYDSYEKIYSVSLGTMKNSQNLKTECGNGYTDYTTSVLAPTLRVGDAIPFSVLSDQCVSNPYSSPSGMSIFIDYNRDGDFDDVGEKAFTTASQINPAPNNRGGFITIPTDASLGLTKMRVVVSEWEYSPGSCTSTYGEVEDYSVMLYGNNTDLATLPKGYCQAVIDTNLVRPIIINVPTTEPEGYCEVVMDSTTRLNKLPSGYCASTTMSNENEQIFAVSFGSMSNTQNENCSTGYTDYSSTIAAPIVHLGETVPFSVSTNICSPSNNAWSGMAIYIDYNRDGDFNDAGEMAFNNYQVMYSPNIRSYNVVIPANATLGLTKMRVIVAQYNYAQNPCEQFSYGEVEDYAVMIEGPSATAMPNGYCYANASYMADEQIFAVSFGTMNNTQTDNCTTGFTDYSTTIKAPVVRIGESIPFSVTTDECDGPTYFPSGLSIFIDYNRDGVFNDITEKVYTSNGVTMSPNTRSGNIIIPAGVSLGLTKMRVVVSEGNASPGSCGEFGYGEVEDYAVMISGLPTGYCKDFIPYCNGTYENIYSVSLGRMKNSQNNRAECGNGYTDFTGTVSAPTLRLGESVPFSVLSDQCVTSLPRNGYSGMSIFIDYNRDGDFFDDGEKAYTTLGNTGITPAPNNRAGSITIPSNATLGLTMMRIVITQNDLSPGVCYDVLGEVEDYSVIIEAASSTPLPADPSIFDDEQILSVSFGSMNNVQSDNASTNYTNFASTITAPIIRRGENVPFSVKTDEVDKDPYYGSGMSIFIDYNRDGDFNDANEKAYTTTQTTLSPNTRSGGIQIPANAILGLTKMRIVVADGLASPNSCGSFNYGEVEDYSVMIYDVLKVQTVFEDEQIDAVSFGTMNNVQTENSKTNYSDYSLLVKAPTVVMGQSIPFSVSTIEQDGAPYYASGMSIFIDYNRDGDFDDAGEKAYTSDGITVSPNTRIGNILIPTTATAGFTKMRVVVQESVASPGSCITLGYGEVEDYSVIISPVVSIFNEEQISAVSFGTMNNVQTENCATNYTDYSSTVTAPIVTTGTSVPFSVATSECDNAPYYASGMSIFIDYNRDGDFEDPGEKAYTTDGITVSPNTRSGNINIPENATLGLTKMRVVVQDSVASPNSCITLGYGEVEDYAIMIHNVPPVYTILDDEQIKAVSFGTLTNVQTDNCSSNYTDYSSTMAAASVTLGQSVPFSVLTDECDNAPYYASGMSIFIDYNRDGDYNDAGEKAFTTNGTQISPNTRTGNIIIPANATPGLTKMRIVVAEGVSSPEACTPMGYGEVEDYGVMIKIADSATICNVGNVILSASDKIDGLSVATYQWKLGTNVVGTTRTISVNQPGAYSLKVFATNGYSSVALPMIVKDGVSRTTETIRAIASYIWHDVTYTQSTTTATWKGVNAAGCDSIVTLNLTILPACEPIFKEVNIVACNSYTWHGMKFTKTISGVEWTTTNSLGCDSTEVLNLVIKSATTKTSNVTVCSNQLPYQWNGVNYSTAGTYTKVLLNAAGCDSTDKLVLTIKSPTTSNTYLSICPAQLPFTWNGLTFNSGGTYTKTLVNVSGCDSTATLYLSIKANTTSTTRMAVCSNQFPITWNGVSYSTPGTYTAHFTNAAGCDSSANLELTQKLTSSFTEVIEAVGEYTWHGTTHTSSTNTPTWKGVNAVGCDSIVTLNLTILTQCITTDTTLYVTACNSYTFKGIKLYNSTVLDWVGVNRYGCDSIITLNLTIIKPVSTISVTGNTSLCMGDSVKLSANAGATYLWSNGKTTQDIFVKTAGPYTVKVTDVSGCFATSAIKTVTVNSLPTAIISASGTTTFCAGGSVTLQANVGTGLTYLWTPGNATTSSIDVTSSGNYTVRVTNANGCSVSSQATSVTVNEMPTATISYASQLCATGIAIVTQTGQTGGVYSAGQGLSINAASGEINLGASTPGNYVVKYTFSNANCSSEATANITISPMLTPSVVIESNATNNAICAGTQVVFTALGTNGGNAPTYQWKLNNNNVGTNVNTYTNASLSNGDVVTVVMTSNAAPCLTVATVSSNEITTTVNANSSATVNIASSDLDNTICAGTSVVFTANSTNGGASPVYQWKLNNVNVGTNNYQYSNASLTSTDVVKVVMTSNQAGCLIGSPATSNGITTTVNANLPTTVSIASSASNNAIGAGTSVTFTATPINGGLNPTYQWKLNNVNVGYNTSQYANNALLNADSVKVTMTASADACSSGPTAVSNSIVTTVTNQLMVPTITANGPLTFCEGESVVLTASGGNSRYATSVLSFSSQYDECGFDFSSCQILGQPDTYPLYTNDIGTAWSPLEEDNSNGEFIELGYDAATSTPINFIDIYETFGAGSIVNVKVKNPSTGQFVSVYTATAASVGDVSRKLHITFPLTAFPVNAIRIEMNTLAVAGFNNIDAVAIGKDVVGHTYRWSNGATTQEIVANTSGEYTVTVSDNMGQSKTSTVTLVTVKVKPTAALTIVGSSTICSGTNASLSIAITNNSTGPWSGVLSDSTPFSGSVSPIIVPVSPASTEDYSISILNAGSCSAIASGLTGTQTVTVVEIPTAELSGTAEICKGTPANLTITITGNGSGPWTGTLSDGTQFGGSVSPILVPISPSSTTTYHIVSLSGAFCSATSLGDEATITVNELPTATISYVSPVCATGIASVNQTGTLGGVYSSTTGLAIDAETGDINLDGSEAGTYLITYTFSDGVCSNSTTASITINVLPTATISYPSDLCPIGTAIVIRTGTAGGTYISGVGLVIDANTGLIDLASSVPDSYVVTYSFRVGGCDNSATTTITIHKLPVATISYAPAYCPTGTALVVLEGQTGGTFSSSTGLVIDANTGSITLESSTPGTYEVAYLFSDGYCSNTVKTFVTIYEAPVAEISYGATPYCKTGIANVTQTGTTDGVYSSTAGLVINANTGEVNLAASTPGTYTVRYEFTNGNCGNVATASIVINALSSKPTITASGPTTFCAGGNVTLTASDANSYLWNTGETTKSITVGSAGTYSVKVQKESNCNSDTTQVLVVVNPLPVVPAIAGANGVCIGSTTLFTNTKANGTWSSASPLVATVSATGVVTGLTSGISVISYTVVENGCSTIVTKSITVNVLPAAPAATGATICGSGSVTLTATAPTRGTVAWYDVATLGTPLATTTSYVTPVLTASKTYYVEGKTTSTGCVSSTRTVVEVLITSGPAAPSVTAAGRCSAGTVQLTATPPTGATVAWFSSTTSTTILSTANTYTTPSISVSTTYYVESRTAATCVSARVPVVATIATAPATPTLPVNGSVCGSGVVTLKATAPTGVTVDWYDAATGGTLLQSGTTTGVNSYTTTSLSATKLYYAQARNILAGCLSVSRLTVTATVNALPAAPAANGATRCGPGALLLTSTAPSGGSVAWYDVEFGGTALATTTSYTTATLTATKIYYVASKITATGCVSATRTVVTATITATPEPPTASDVSRCGTGTVILTATPPTSATVAWFAASTGGTALSTTSPYTTASISTTTSYYVESRFSTTCVSTTRTIVKGIVNPIPAAPTGVTGTRCGPGVVTISASTAVVGASIEWYATNTSTTILGTGNSFNTPSITANTTYYAAARSSAGCLSARTSVAATISPLLAASASITGTTAVCPIVGTATTTNYTAAIVTNATSYKWTVPAGAVITSALTGRTITVRFTTVATGDAITVQGVASNGCAGNPKTLALSITACATPVLLSSANTNKIKAVPVVETLTVKVFPNPSNTLFNLNVTSSSTEKVQVRMMDARGSILKTVTINPSNTLRIGEELRPGVYMFEVRQGGNTKVVKAIKF